MTDYLKLAEMQRTNVEIERQRHLTNWLIKSSPHMATPQSAITNSSSTTAITTTTSSLTPSSTAVASTSAPAPANLNCSGLAVSSVNSAYPVPGHFNSKHSSSMCVNSANNSTTNPVFYLMTNNCNNGTVSGVSSAVGLLNSSSMGSNCKYSNASHHQQASNHHGLHHLVEGRKAKLRRFNSHDTSSNMFSVADFENARLARRNEIELKQRLQRRMRNGFTGSGASLSTSSGQGLNNSNMSADYSTGDSKASKHSTESQNDPLPVEEFLERYSLPRVVRISYKTPFSIETLQSSSSNNSSTITSTSSTSCDGEKVAHASNTTHDMSNCNTGTSSSTSSGAGHNDHAIQTLNSNSSSDNSATKLATTSESNAGNNHPHSNDDEQGELFLLYRLIRQRNIYHGHNAKTAATSRKKGVMIPQEFPGYFSMLNDKGVPTATLYTSLVQLVRERVCKFVSVDNMAAFMESQPNGSNANSPADGCLHIYSSNTNNSHNRPHYVKTTARGGQVFKLLAVYEDGKQEHSSLTPTISCGGLGATKQTSYHGREKERSRYAQLLNEQRQTLYVSLATKGKFYEIEPGIPQILQKRLDIAGDNTQRKLNTECVHRITALVTPNKELPLTLKYISGPNGCASAIPDNICVTRVSTENIIIACPIEDVEMQSPLHLRKLHLTKEMNLVKNTLGFENEQRMFSNPNVQNILKFCQFNCDQFLKMVEVEVLQRSERSASKSRVEGLKILKPLHFPKLLRREKTTIPAHEKEDSIIFLSKSDLANMESKDQSFDDQANRITEKMKVFQTTKKKWFRKQEKNSEKQLSSSDIDAQAKKMSMERYSDMSKLLQERFGHKTTEQECISEPSGCQSDVGFSDTETTTLTTIDERLKKFTCSKSNEPNVLQKSLSLQDIELIGRKYRKPDILSSHNTTDTISESGTDIDDMENREPPQSSFITEKLYHEFHVKTKQYSKSSSSLHQLLNFSLPQKLQIGENKKSLAQLKSQASNRSCEKRIDFSIGEPVTGRRAAGGLSLLVQNSNNPHNTSLIAPLTPIHLIEDDLPYSSVRDSLILSSDEGSPPDVPTGTMCQALHLIDYAKENIYAEICHEASAVGGIPTSQTRDTFSGITHSTHISDDFGDYASLTCPQPSTANVLGNAISRVQITCSESPISYHTVYLGEERLGEPRPSNKERDKSRYHNSHDRSHVTTVDVVNSGDNTLASGTHNAHTESQSDSGVIDNIYNTLK
ncbi:uncharacterized protein LOC133326224 [Musca vetustissima]|uniref:uncharacterized protein LOC133326224 n=1 Tax=Musca vetustissima TaxID=27455 RepID=UPI002AB646CD|nr:uncharacterized protein LOC133326224 [Musca vetustissima]